MQQMLVPGPARAAVGRALWRAGAALCLGPSLLLLLACLGGPVAEGGLPASVASGGDLVVRRGELTSRLLLSGKLVSADADLLAVPRTGVWQMQVRWMAPDGATVAAGETVVELDNTSFLSDLEAKRLEAERTTHDLARLEAETEAALAEKQFAVERERSELAAAELAADIPEGLLAARELEDRQLALARAQVELAKAEADLASHRLASAADLALKQVELATTRREIATSEEGIDKLVLRAPRAGVVVASTHPWHRRKVQAGDMVWVGLGVATLPDLSALAVDAALYDVDDGRVRPGMPAVCVLDAYPGERFPGRVTAVAPMARELAADSPLRLFRVAVALDRIDRERMRPGLSVRVEVLADRRPDVLLAPRAGLDLGAWPPRARLVSGGERPVRLGPCAPLDCVVLEGLAAGERLRPAAESGG